MITKEEQERIKKYALERAERICNGGFPIEYSREQVVNHTKNDFVDGATYERELANTELSKLRKENEIYKETAFRFKTENEQLQSDKKELVIGLKASHDAIMLLEEFINVIGVLKAKVPIEVEAKMKIVGEKMKPLMNKLECVPELLAKHSNQNSDGQGS